MFHLNQPFFFLPAVSKSLSFTEEPLGITTEAVMDLITTQIKEDGLESTVEIVVHEFTSVIYVLFCFSFG